MYKVDTIVVLFLFASIIYGVPSVVELDRLATVQNRWMGFLNEEHEKTAFFASGLVKGRG